MGYIIGRNTRVEVATTLSAAIAVSAISKANPAVVSYEGATDPPDGSVVLLSINTDGMFELAGQAARTDNANTAGSPATLELEGINSTGFGTLDGETSLVYAVSWSTLGNAKTFSQAEGSVNKKDQTVLLDSVLRSRLAQSELPDIKVDMLSNPFLTAVQFVKDAALDGDIVIFRVTCEDGSKRVCAGYVSLPGESMTVQEIATSDFTIVQTGGRGLLAYAS